MNRIKNIVLTAVTILSLALAVFAVNTHSEIDHLQTSVNKVQPQNVLTCRDLKTLSPSMNVAYLPKHCLTAPVTQ